VLAELELCLKRQMSSGQIMKKRLLVVDDDPSIRESMGKILKENGYEVLLAENGEEAEKILGTEKVELLLLDLEMPKKDGWDVFEGVRSGSSLLPIIVITGLANELETRRITGLDALLEKPVEVPMLLKKIEELLAESTAQRQAKLSGCLEIALANTRAVPGYLTFLPTGSSKVL
jgi:DNA-binding response OmpR family regulator